MTNEQGTPTLNDIWGGFNGDKGLEAPAKPVDISTQPPAAPPAPPTQQPIPPAAPAPSAAPVAPAQPAAPAAPAEQKPAEQKPAEEEAPEGSEDEQDEDQDDSPMGFWNDVDALRGRPITIDGKPVDLSTFDDPTSPEAYMAVENAVRQEAMNDYDTYIEQTDPRAYAYFLHRRNGGSDAEFFERASDQLPDYETFKGNVDLQKKVITTSLKGRGVSDKVIALTIQEAEKDGSLFSEAEREYRARETEDTATLNALKKMQQDREEAYTQRLDAVETEMDNVVLKGQTKKIVIPEAKRSEFSAWLKGKLHHDDATGTFIIGQKVDKTNLTDILESLYFQYSGGDVSKLVKAGVRTEAARRLGRNVAKASQQAASTQNKENNTPGFIPLTELF